MIKSAPKVHALSLVGAGSFSHTSGHLHEGGEPLPSFFWCLALQNWGYWYRGLGEPSALQWLRKGYLPVFKAAWGERAFVVWLYSSVESATQLGRKWNSFFFFTLKKIYLMAPHSSTLGWKIPWTEEPGGLQSMGSLRVGHDGATSLLLFTFMHWRRTWQPTPVFLPGEFQGPWSLVGCRLWGHTQSDTTEVT